MVEWVFMYIQDPKLLGVFINDMRASGFWASDGQAVLGLALPHTKMLSGTTLVILAADSTYSAMRY